LHFNQFSDQTRISITRPGLAKPDGAAGSSAFSEDIELIAVSGLAGAEAVVAAGSLGKLERWLAALKRAANALRASLASPTARAGAAV